MSRTLASPRLSALIAGRRPAAAAPPIAESFDAPGADAPALACELCAEPIAERHRHLVDVQERGLKCVCRACSILFDRREAGGGHYRLVPDRCLRLADFDLPEELWAAFGVPVDLAFLFHDTAAGRVVAFYPGPMGATESQLGLDRWPEVVERNPVVRELEPDVEALLVDRTGDEARYWLVPIDACYELVAIIRTSWKGLAGGEEVWARIASFFNTLRARAVEPARARSAG